MKTDLNDISPPADGAWSSNWKFEADDETELEGWKEYKKLVIKCLNGKMLQYPPITKRPLRRRTWYRKFQRKSERIAEEESNSQSTPNAMTTAQSRSLNPFADADENATENARRPDPEVQHVVSGLQEKFRMLDLKLLSASGILKVMVSSASTEKAAVGLNEQRKQRDLEAREDELLRRELTLVSIDLNQAQSLLLRLKPMLTEKSDQFDQAQSKDSESMELFKSLESLLISKQSRFTQLDNQFRKLQALKPQRTSTMNSRSKDATSVHVELTDEAKQSQNLQLALEEVTLIELQEEELDVEVETNDQLLKEREVAIQELGKDIREVHETMQELSTIVQTQSETLGTVVSHTDKAKQRTEKAVKELEKAEKMQKSADCVIS